jgi:hypothetical protein
MKQCSRTTRLREYISLVLPEAHGHQQKAVSDFVRALIIVQTCRQAAPARFFDNFEAASKRLSRLLHNARLEAAARLRRRAHQLRRGVGADFLLVAVALLMLRSDA